MCIRDRYVIPAEEVERTENAFHDKVAQDGALERMKHIESFGDERSAYAATPEPSTTGTQSEKPL